MSWIEKNIWVFVVALLSSLIFTVIVRRIALRFGVLDHPNERKIHTEPIPLWGGLAIFAAYIFSLFLVAFSNAIHLKAIIFGSLPVLILGVIDDIRPVPATLKLFLLISLTLWLSSYGIIVRLSGIYIIDSLVTILWIVGITSAFNSIDNMDGLACGISGIIALMFFIVAITSAQWEFGILSCALLGAALGFLPFNFHPAKIFLGNGGSLFLGFNLGTVAIMGGWSQNRFIAFTIPVLIMAMPIFDILYVIILRYRQGLTPSLQEIINYCGRDHLSHRLQGLGFKQRGVVILLYILSLCLGLGAIMLKVETNEYDAAILVTQALMIILIIGVLLNIKGNNHTLK
jgi:UDP-GlcNAc:undecaprenyl-phosphate GlcNAc-1-phosphate transferase